MSLAIPPSATRTARPRISSAEAVRQLEDRLSDTRRRVVAKRVNCGVLVLGCLVALALGAVALADYFLELATAWRAMWLLAVGGGVVSGAVWGWRRLISSYTLSQTAVDAEQRAAQFGQRLRTTLDYSSQSSRPAVASPGLLDALHVETQQVVQQVDWNSLVDTRLLKWSLVGVAGCAMAWFVLLLSGTEMRLAAGRALLLPLQYTTVTYSPESSTVKFGEDVSVQAEVAGRPISSAILRYRPSGSQEAWTELDLVPPETSDELASDEPPSRLTRSQRRRHAAADRSTPASDVPEAKTISLHGPLSVTLADLRHDLEFEVLAGPRALPVGSIRVLQPLKLEKQSARIVPPAYTGRKPETSEKLELTVLEGSNVELALELNRPAAEGLIVRTSESTEESPGKAGLPSQTATIPVAIDGSVLRIALADLRKSGEFTITAQAADGMTLDPLKLEVKVKLDRPPSVQFLAPPEELSVTPTTDVPMVIEAGDDLGLFKVGIAYQVGSGPLKTLWEEDAAGTTDPLHGAAVLMLEEHQVTFQDAVTYHAFAEDNYFGTPRRTTTPLRFIDIRPYKLAFQLSEGGGACCNNSVTLEELIQRQRQQLRQAFATQQTGSADSETVKGLAAGESELLEKTTEFWEGLVALAGPIPALEEAVGHMQTAVTALEQAELADGVSAEQQALAALIKARENVRKKMNQSPSASQCQKFDKAQQQKLRLPPKKEQDKQQQLAEARKKLDDLAQRERKWSQEAKSACQNPSSGKSSGKPSAGAPASSPSQSGEPMPLGDTSSGSRETSGKSGTLTSSATGQAPTPSPSKEEVAQAQEQMLEELAAIAKQLPQLSQSGEAAQEQAEQAAKSMQKGLDEVKQNRGEDAAQAGERSADELEQLAAHLAAMNAKDVGQRLDQAQKLAQQLAARQEAVEKQLAPHQPEASARKPGGKPSAHQPEAPARKPGEKPSGGKEPGGKESGDQPGSGQEPGGEKPSASGEKLAGEEQKLATQAKLLAEQLAKLARDAAAEPGNLGQKLSQLNQENPPQEIAAAMEQAADDLKHERRQQAGKGVTKSREQLQELTRGLGEAKNQFAQPQLDELMKLEEQLAQLMKRSERAKAAGAKPDAADAEKWQQLAARLEALAAGDRRLAEALKQLAAAHLRTGNEPPPDGVYPEMELIDAPNLREVAKALQTKIQEAILASALQDADQGVPREYRVLVEKYYKALSDDLR